MGDRGEGQATAHWHQGKENRSGGCEPGQGQAQPLLYCPQRSIVGAGLVPALAHTARPRPEVTDLPASPSPTPFPFLDARLAMNGGWINPIPTKHADGWIRTFWYSEL